MRRRWMEAKLRVFLNVTTQSHTIFVPQCMFKSLFSILCSMFPIIELREVKLLSHVQIFVIPWTIAYQVPPSTGFSRQ